MKVKPDPKFAARLQRLMEERNLTTSQLARRMFGEVVEKRKARNGLEYESTVAAKRNLVNAWQKGTHMPAPQHQQELARHLNVPLSEILGDQGAGITVGEVDGEGMCLVEMSLRLPEHIAKTVYHIVEEYRR